MIFQDEWLPNEVSNGCGGREIASISLLGPFLAVTVFAEEDATVAEKFPFEKQGQATVRSLTQQLQKELELLRVSFSRCFFDDEIMTLVFSPLVHHRTLATNLPTPS